MRGTAGNAQDPGQHIPENRAEAGCQQDCHVDVFRGDDVVTNRGGDCHAEDEWTNEVRQGGHQQGYLRANGAR